MCTEEQPLQNKWTSVPTPLSGGAPCILFSLSRREKGENWLPALSGSLFPITSCPRAWINTCTWISWVWMEPVITPSHLSPWESVFTCLESRALWKSDASCSPAPRKINVFTKHQNFYGKLETLQAPWNSKEFKKTRLRIYILGLRKNPPWIFLSSFTFKLHHKTWGESQLTAKSPRIQISLPDKSPWQPRSLTTRWNFVLPLYQYSRWSFTSCCPAILNCSGIPNFYNSWNTVMHINKVKMASLLE